MNVESIIAELKKLDLKPGDTLLFTTKENLSIESVNHLKKLFDDRHIDSLILCGCDFDISVVKKEARQSVRKLIREVELLKARVEQLESFNAKIC